MICDEPGGPAPNIEDYEPTSWPGARLPHVWIEPGEVSVHDRIGDGFTLLRLARERPMRAACKKPSPRIGAPFAVLDIESEAARSVYGFDYLLVRPDLHVVWRGNALPHDARKVACTVTGN